MSTFNFSEDLSEEYIYNSCHSYVRAKERAGLKRERAERMIGLARVRGKSYEECTWSLDRKYLYKKTDDETIALAYNGYCFIFSRDTKQCITIIDLPKRFGKKKTFYAGKRDGAEYAY